MRQKHLQLVLSVLLSMYSTGAVFAQEDRTVNLQEIVVYSISPNECFTTEKLDIDSIKPISEAVLQISWLKTLPSISFHSDNGTETGYNYFRMRGIDQSRVNMTLNGAPLNEPEDGGFYFNNIGGLTGILDDMQVVKGAALTKNGSSVLAGGINMNTKKIQSSYADIGASMGYYNSYGMHATIANQNKINTLANFFHYSTDGYKYNSWNKTNTGSYIVNKQFGSRFFLENVGILSNQQNGMAWIGATKEQIATDARTNNNTSAENDDFTTYTTQLIGKYLINDNVLLHTNVYYTHLNGSYLTDLDNLLGTDDLGIYTNTLRQNWVGNFTDLSVTTRNIRTNIGYNAYYFRRRHGGSDATETYSNVGYKREVSPYIKVSYTRGKWMWIGNAQYRYLDFDYSDAFSDFSRIRWNFLNYGVGLTYKPSTMFNIYYSFGKNNKEANRLDMFGGNDYYDPNSFTWLPSERVYDHELGFRYRKGRVSVEVPFYFMIFKNELALNGLINQQGIHLHSSNKSSKRYGMEFDFSYTNRLSIRVNGNWSQNQISDYHHILSPNESANVLLSYDITKSLSISSMLSYIGDCFIDPLNKHKLGKQYQLDLGAAYRYRGLTVTLNTVNITDRLNYTNGYMSSDIPFYFTNAPFRMNLRVGYVIKSMKSRIKEK